MAEPARNPASGAAADAPRLPPGRHGLPRAYVEESQRERLLNGVVEAVAEHGYDAASISRITEAAGISRRTFYEHFENKEECFLAAFELIDAHIREAMLTAPGAAADWPARVRGRLAGLLDALAADPAVARFYLVEPLAAGGEVAARYRDATQLLAALLRPEAENASLDLEVRDQALVGGVTAVIVRRLNAGAPNRLPELLPELVEMILAPCLGRQQARLQSQPPSS